MACCHLLTPHTLEVPLMLVPIWGKISSSGACWLAAKKNVAAKNVESTKNRQQKNNTGPNVLHYTFTYDPRSKYNYIYIMSSFKEEVKKHLINWSMIEKNI